MVSAPYRRRAGSPKHVPQVAGQLAPYIPDLARADAPYHRSPDSGDNLGGARWLYVEPAHDRSLDCFPSDALVWARWHGSQCRLEEGRELGNEIVRLVRREPPYDGTENDCDRGLRVFGRV